jgi:hypothetical protein
MIQKVIFEGGIFSRGGFALHKIKGKFSGHCSAWFSPQGKLEDCEWIRRDGVYRSIPPHSPMFRYLESLGPIWK